jgi:hypothetical protein
MIKFFKKRQRDPEQYAYDFKKTVEVAVSCVTADQCDVATKFVEAYIRLYNVMEKHPFLMMLCPKVLEYLRDTKEHCLHGKHHPVWTNGLEITAYPDINSYTKGLLDIRLGTY